MAFNTTSDAIQHLASSYAVFIPLITVLLYIFYQRFLSPLAGIPGPFLASISRIWITRLSWVGGTHKVMVALHKKHGKLVRIAPNEVSVAEPKAIKQIYGAGTKFRKSDWYSVWQGRRKFDLFPERDEKIHASQRRLVTRPYAMEALKELESYVDDAIDVFFKHMEDIRNNSIDLGKWIQLFAFDVVGELTFSKRFGFMDAGQDDGSFGKIQQALRSASWVGQMPWIYWLNDYLSPIIGNRLAISARHGSLRNFAVSEVEARKERGSDHKDILGKLIEVHAEKPTELDETSVMSMATSNIFAGSDTTAVSTRACFYYLLKNPEYMKRLVEEVDSKRKAGKLSDIATTAEAEQMPFLQAVIYEALRCHPAVGMSLPRVVPAGGFEVDGKRLPAGTVIGTNPWVIHKNKDVFGKDAESFNPDRWLGDGVAEMHRCFFTFGGGARMCIGKNIGWMEMEKLIPTMLMRYNVQLTEPDAEWTMTSWWFVMQKGLNVTLTPRA